MVAVPGYVEGSGRSSKAQKALIFSLIFIVPGIATLLGYIYVSFLAGPPVTDTRSCEHFLTDRNAIRLQVNAFRSGLDFYEDQILWVTRDAGGVWEELSRATVFEPAQQINCENQIKSLSAETALVWHLKGLAITHDNGNTWLIHTLCDGPLPPSITTRSCRNSTIHNVEFDDVSQGRIVFMLDASEYSLITADGGRSWQVMDE